jgi:hypothetical protein
MEHHANQTDVKGQSQTRHARDVERFRELAARRKAIAGTQSAIDNGASNLAIDFAAEIFPPDQADVE